MPASYLITEPHPTILQNTYTHSGRGGAGNTFRAPATTAPSGVPTQVKPVKTSSTRFYSGRGGAGNARAASDRPVLNFDEEFVRADSREKAQTIGHVGRGGAGNYYTGSSSSGGSTKDERRDSASTDGSTRSGFFGRLSSSFSRH